MQRRPCLDRRHSCDHHCPVRVDDRGDRARHHLDHPGARHIGLLAADGTLAVGLYQPYLPHPLLLASDEQTAFMRLVYRIKSGDVGPEICQAMAALAASLVSRGADLVLAACTEVPLVLRQEAVAVPLLDATSILVAETAARARAAPITSAP